MWSCWGLSLRSLSLSFATWMPMCVSTPAWRGRRSPAAWGWCFSPDQLSLVPSSGPCTCPSMSSCWATTSPRGEGEGEEGVLGWSQPCRWAQGQPSARVGAPVAPRYRAPQGVPRQPSSQVSSSPGPSQQELADRLTYLVGLPGWRLIDGWRGQRRSQQGLEAATWRPWRLCPRPRCSELQAAVLRPPGQCIGDI